MPPTQFTPEVRERILAALRQGNYMETACTYAGVSAPTVRKWVVKGMKPNAPAEFAEFARDVAEAQASIEVRHVQTISRTALGVIDPQSGIYLLTPDWHAAAWFIERKYPERWGKRDTFKVTVEQLNTMSDEEVEKEAKRRGIA